MTACLPKRRCLRFDATLISAERRTNLSYQTLRSTPTRPTSSGCTISRFGDALARDPTTGPSARTRIPARKLAAGIRELIIIPAPHARSSVQGSAGRGMTASSPMGFSNAGFILRGIEPSPAKTARRAAAESVSSPTRRSSSAFFPRSREITRWMGISPRGWG